MRTKQLTSKPTHEVISAIQALDLQSVKVRLMDPELGEGWTPGYAESIEAAYKNFLLMIVKYPQYAEELMLANDVDTFWHTHILQTRKYATDCEKMFGIYLHHSPHIGERTAADLEKRAVQAQQTLALYEQEFGDAAVTAWSGRGASQAPAAFSSAATGLRALAYSGVAVNDVDGAWSGPAIEPRNSAWSGLDIRASP